MRVNQFVKLLLATAGYLAGQPAWAQRAAVAPLAPLPPVVRSASPMGVGVPVDTQPPRQTPPFQERLGASALRPSQPEPVYLLNSRFIINELYSINPQSIAKIDVYKSNAPIKWQSLNEHGIIDVTLKHSARLKVKSKSLAAIRRQAKVSGPVSFQLNSQPLEDASLRIAAAIAGLDVLRSAGVTVINIRLAPPAPAPPRHDPPGTIYIRGVAGR